MSAMHVLELGPKVGRATLRIEETPKRFIVEETLPLEIPEATAGQLRAIDAWRDSILRPMDGDPRTLFFLLHTPLNVLISVVSVGADGKPHGVARQFAKLPGSRTPTMDELLEIVCRRQAKGGAA